MEHSGINERGAGSAPNSDPKPSQEKKMDFEVLADLFGAVSDIFGAVDFFSGLSSE